MIDESLLEEWNYEKNENPPEYYSYQSSQKVWWRCSKGHEWMVSIANRVAGNGCPYCANQKVLVGYNDLATTNPELLDEWNYEKNGDLMPQMVVAGTDKKVWWKCSKGHEWQSRIANRSRGARCPYCAGRKVLPGYNDLASKYPDIASEWSYEKNGELTPQFISTNSHAKVWWKCSKGHEWQTQVYHRVKDSGCPVCSGHKVLPGYNDLTTTNPSLAAEWNYEKNVNLHPESLTKASNKIVWWKCSLGHEWSAAINSRNSGNGCPYCSNQKVLYGYNDLATSNPNLAAEWDYEKNKNITPQMITIGSGKKYWWHCDKGHSWKAIVSHRKNGVGCPICAGQVVLSGFNDLATVNPKLAAEWNYNKNGSLVPSNITAGSEKKVWWICSKGHEWKAGIGQRNSGKLGCPICSNKQVLVGLNDLETTHPEIAAEWNYEKNGTLTPQSFTAGSNKLVWWRCKNGHEWKAQVNARLQGAGCAKCSAYLRTSFPEQALYFYIKQVYPDAVNGYRDLFDARKTVMELDIFIPSLHTAIEYDGMVWHSSSKALSREQIKYEICHENGIRLIRIKEAISENAPTACDVLIQSEYSGNYRFFGNTLTKLSEYIPLPIDIDLGRDRNSIFAQYLPDLDKESVFSTHPDLMIEWNYNKNTDISPKTVTAKGKAKVWWVCSKGHEWQALISERIKGTSCPYCTNRKVLVGYNDLATTHPMLAKEWDCVLNGKSTPYMVTSGSGRKVWWKCKKGHEWQATVNSRRDSNGCPYCSGHRVLKGFNDLGTTNELLASEWDYELNESLTPQDVTAGSNKSVWWRCSSGHKWQAQINARNRGNGCPYCSGRKKNKG